MARLPADVTSATPFLAGCDDTHFYATFLRRTPDLNVTVTTGFEPTLANFHYICSDIYLSARSATVQMLKVLLNSSTPLKLQEPRPVRLFPPETPGQDTRRRKLWDLSDLLHCSIIGTCLGTSDLRRIVAKAFGEPHDRYSDHDIHKRGVALASEPRIGAKLLQKALDARYAAAIRHFDKATDVEDIRNLWNEARSKGEIPGAYWAALTNPLTTEGLVADIFGDVHMLSHLVGAANRADIRRLAEIEAENTKLVDKVHRQQTKLHELALAHRQEINRLEGHLAERLVRDADGAEPSENLADSRSSLEELATRLQLKLNKEIARREKSDREREALRAERAQLAEEVRLVSAREKQAVSELLALEAHVANCEQEKASDDLNETLSGMTILYVGGRTGNIPQLRLAAEKRGAKFEHHDGGQQEATSLLPGPVSRADVIFFPVECVSHEAALSVKRHCKQAGKPYVPLPGAGLGSFLNALSDAHRMKSDQIPRMDMAPYQAAGRRSPIASIPASLRPCGCG